MPTSRSLYLLALILAASSTQSATAASSNDAIGLWRTAESDAVIDFKACPDEPSTMCGTIVWDKDAGASDDTCGVRISKLKRYDGDAWRDGWVYDPRSNKHFKGAVRVNGSTMSIRAYIGTEVLGETEELTRVESLPTTPVCKKNN